MAESTRDRLIRYLQDAHAAEIGIEEVLSGFVDDASDPDVRDLFESHRAETKTQADRLEARLHALGEKPSSGKGFMNSLLAKMSEIMHAAHDEYDKNTQNLIKAYSTEHLERGMYESLAAYAEVIGDLETATLARNIQAEEEATAEKIWPHIQGYAKTAILGAEDTRGGAYTS
jgi:ferritin-like metal-binding protein YciE